MFNLKTITYLVEYTKFLIGISQPDHENLDLT